MRSGNVRKLLVKIQRVLRRQKPQRWHPSTPSPLLAEALGASAAAGSVMLDHLSTIFFEAVSAKPRLIVELGTSSSGNSTRALLAAAEASDAQLLSVDIVDCSRIAILESLRGRWTFVMGDDVAFAGEPFERHCSARNLPPESQAILIDTSHEYTHSVLEIRAWAPRLARGGVMMFHDTNMGDGWFRRLDGKRSSSCYTIPGRALGAGLVLSRTLPSDQSGWYARSSDSNLANASGRSP